jgi:hypothetical protein
MDRKRWRCPVPTEQLQRTARVCIGARSRRLGFRGDTVRRSAVSAPRLGQPLGRVIYARYAVRNCDEVR